MTAPPVTLILTIVIIGFSFWGFNNMGIFERYKFHVGKILGGKEWYRVLTSGFLHGGIGHLAMNLLSFYFAGEVLEPYYAYKFGMFGIPVYLFLFVGSLLGGSLLSLYMNKGNYGYSAIGASGAISGMLFAFVVLAPTSTVELFFFIPMPMWLFAVLFVGYSLYGIRTQMGRIGHDAHLGGALSGLVLASILSPMAALNNWMWVLPFTALMVLGILALKKDTRFATQPLAFFKDRFNRKPKPRFNPNGSNLSTKPRVKQDGLEINLRATAQAEMDQLLEKVSRKGDGGLTVKEKFRLKELADYLDRSGGPGGHRAPSE